MSSLDEVVQITIDVASAAPTRAGFGVPLIAAYHTNFQDWVREYSDPSEMLDDGFTTGSMAFQKALTLMSQSPHLRTFKIGRLATPWTYTYLLGPQVINEGYVYDFTVNGIDITYTVLAAATKSIVATALQLLIDVISGVTASVFLSDFVQVENDVAGEAHSIDLKNHDPLDDLTYKNDTPNVGIVADLTQIRKIDDRWYGLLLDMSSANIDPDVAAWVEGLKMIYVLSSSDSEIIDGAVSDDLFSVLKSNSYRGTTSIFSHRPPFNIIGTKDAAWLGLMLTFDPGTATWAYQTLIGTPIDVLQVGWRSAIEFKNGNMYVDIGGLGATWEGKSAFGDYTDIVRFIDFLMSRIQEAVYAAKRNAIGKVPFTDVGIETLANAVRAVLQANVSTPTNALGLAPNPPPVVTVPKALDVAEADRIDRILRTIEFEARLSGAIHTTIVKGRVSV